MTSGENYPPCLLANTLKDDRICRVFFSSPFLGIEKERQELTKSLPRLSQLCRLQGVELTVVDMRWGISTESVSAARTVNICLKELDRSDIFVGFYGQRYGWHGLNDAALQANFDLAVQDYPWLDGHRHRSITEIEYLHGHLNGPGQRPALFCFRDPQYDEDMRNQQIEETDKSAFTAESDHAKVLLDDLKSRVIETREQCIDVQEAYKTPKEMAVHVFQCLYNYIRDVLLNNTMKRRQRTQGSPLDQHDVFRVSRCRIYAGSQYIHKLDQMLKETNRIVVHGETGCGKSALVCNWLQASQTGLETQTEVETSQTGLETSQTEVETSQTDVETSQTEVETSQTEVETEADEDHTEDIRKDPDPGQESSGTGKSTENTEPDSNPARRSGAVYIYHAVGGAPSSTGVIQLLQRLIEKLTAGDDAGEVKPAGKAPKELDDYVMAFNDVLNKLGRQHVYIVVDGVDKLTQAKKAQKPLFWVPLTLPSHVTMILTMASGATSDLEVARDKLGYRELIVEPLSGEEKKMVASEILRKNSKELPSDELAVVVEAPQTSNPLYLSIFMKELCTVDYYLKVGVKINEMLESDVVTGIFNKFIERLEVDYNTPECVDAVKKVLSVLQLLKFGIQSGDVTELLGLPSAVWVPIQYSVLPYLLTSQGYLAYEFPEMKTAVWTRYLKDDDNYRLSMMKEAADFMYGQYTQRRAQGVKQEYMLLNAMDLYYQLEDGTSMRDVLGDAVSLQRLYQIDSYQCIEYWQRADLPGRQAGEFLSKAADRYSREVGKSDDVLKFLDLVNAMLDMLMNYKAKEIVLYKAQKLTRECSSLSEEERTERLDRIHYALATLYSTTGEGDVSVRLHEKLLEKRLKDPTMQTTTEGRAMIADSYHGLAIEYSRMKKDTQLVYDMYKKATDLYDDEDKKAGTANNIALVLMDMGRYAEAQEAMEKIVKRYDDQYLGEPPSEYGAFIMNLALTHRKQNHLDEAEELYNRALAFNERLLGKDHILVGKILLNLVNVFTLRGKHQSAAEVAERAMHIFLAHFEDTQMWCLMAMENTAKSYVELKEFEKATPIFWRAFEARLKSGTVAQGLQHLYQSFIMHHVNRGDFQETANIITAIFDHFENPRFYGILAICDHNTDPRPERSHKFSLDAGIERFPNELFNLLYKFKYDVMTPEVTSQDVMAFSRRHHALAKDDGSFILSVATWLVDDYDRYDLAGEVVLFATETFKNDANINRMLDRVYQHYSSQENKNWPILLSLIQRIVEISSDVSANYVAACKVAAMNARTDLTRFYADRISEMWPDDEQLTSFVTTIRKVADDVDAAMAKDTEE